MKFSIAAAATGAVAASAMTFDHDVELFREFKQTHSRVYESDAHELSKFETFKENLAYINSHNLNADVHGFELGIGPFADMTNGEYRETLSPFTVGARKGLPYRRVGNGIPDSIDWRTRGYVTPVKDQRACGSCWAFSTVASYEGQYFNKTGTLTQFSEQQLVDCSKDFGNMGCSGGLMSQGFDYIKSLAPNSLDTEDSYPYYAHELQQCKVDHGKQADPVAQLKSYVDVTSGDEAALTEAIANVGTISVAIDASHASFQHYKSGVYLEPACSSDQLDHGVAAVGYGKTTFGKEYYIVKNSWNVMWGMKGYINMARNKKNNCGIATQASYPVL